MKKPKSVNNIDTPVEVNPAEVEWPRPARVSRVRQPMNRRMLTVDFSETESANIGVRDNAFYRAGEKVLVAKDAGGSLVDAKPKTNALLRGGQE